MKGRYPFRRQLLSKRKAPQGRGLYTGDIYPILEDFFIFDGFDQVNFPFPARLRGFESGTLYTPEFIVNPHKNGSLFPFADLGWCRFSCGSPLRLDSARFSGKCGG
jgi:hypothetical protein